MDLPRISSYEDFRLILDLMRRFQSPETLMTTIERVNSYFVLCCYLMLLCVCYSTDIMILHVLCVPIIDGYGFCSCVCENMRIYPCIFLPACICSLGVGTCVWGCMCMCPNNFMSQGG